MPLDNSQTRLAIPPVAASVQAVGDDRAQYTQLFTLDVLVCLKSRDSNARANGRDRKSGGANIIGANGLAMEWRARSPLQMARVHRGFGTYQGCALTHTPYSRHCFQTHDCRVSCLGRALRRLTTADVFDWRCVDAARRRCPSASSSCCRKPRAGLHSASMVCCVRPLPRCCRGDGWACWRWCGASRRPCRPAWVTSRWSWVAPSLGLRVG